MAPVNSSVVENNQPSGMSIDNKVEDLNDVEGGVTVTENSSPYANDDGLGGNGLIDDNVNKLMADGSGEMGHRWFYVWLGLLIFFFSTLGIAPIFLYEQLIDHNKQQKVQDYILTVVLLYAYIRFNIHIVTRRLMLKWSPTLRTMPIPIQDDCVFMVVDGTTFFMVVPNGAYLIANVFNTPNRDAFFERQRPYFYCVFGLYAMDRFIHLMNHFRINRLIHHFVETIWVLYVLEWNIATKNLGIILFGCVIETLSKAMWYWMVRVRYARRHVKLTKSITSPTQGIDGLFIPKTPERMAFWAQAAQIHHYNCTIVIPVVLLTLYAFKANELPIFWKICNFLMVILFSLIDLPLSKVLWQQSKVEYWKKTILEIECKEEKREATSSQ